MTQEFLLAECRKRGLKVYSADQGQLIDMAENGGDPTRVLIRQILGALAQWEKNDAGFKSCQGEGTSEGGYRAMWRQAALRLDETGEAYS